MGDPSLSIGGVRNFYLVGNALTPGDDRLELDIPERLFAVGPFEIQIDGSVVGEMNRAERRAFDIGLLEPGEHRVVVRDEGDDAIRLDRTFVRSHPLYVIVSTDWDTSDNPDANMRRQDMLHENHPHLRMTHFFGPYAFTDPTLTPARRDVMVEWVTNARDTYDDEIGLHIHPYCSFVGAAGVTCRIEPWYAPHGGSAGYTTHCGAYSEEEFTVLLEHAKDLFETHGLGVPRTFRAGGWTLEAHTMRALANAGFVADTSANNWARLEEWMGVPGTTLYQWNAEHWAPIDERSQPYYPSPNDLLATGESPVLEVPDNGCLADYVTTEEMVEMLRANWDGTALTSPRQYSIGYHPPSLDTPTFDRMNGALDEIDRHLAVVGEGPIVYATLSEIVRVWPRSAPSP